MLRIVSVFAILLLGVTTSWADSRLVTLDLDCTYAFNATPTTDCAATGSTTFTYQTEEGMGSGAECPAAGTLSIIPPSPDMVYTGSLTNPSLNANFALSNSVITLSGPSACNIGFTLEYTRTNRLFTVTATPGGGITYTIQNTRTNTLMESGTGTISIPEPGTLALFATGLTVLVLRKRRRTH